MGKEMIWETSSLSSKPIKFRWDDLDKSIDAYETTSTISSISYDEDLPTGLSYDIPKIEILEERVNTLIKAITNLIRDKENLEKQVAYLTDKLSHVEAEGLIVKTDMATLVSSLETLQKDYEKLEDKTTKIEADNHETIADLVNIINEKLDKA